MSDATFHLPGEAERIDAGQGSGIEHYMRELGDAAQRGALTPEVMGPIASRYDFESA